MDTQAILTLIQETAADVINPRFQTLGKSEIHEKEPGDQVTDADREAEQLITETLRAAYPDALVLGEEAAAHDPTLLDRYAHADHAFTVDPVDGTKNFVRGSRDHAVMVAELRGGVVVRSWIWQPQHELAYVAERGAGAYCNGERIQPLPRSENPAEWRGVSSRRSWVGRRLSGLTPLELSWVCCGVDYPQLLAGAADYLVYFKTLPWDHAPGSLLLTETGGELRTQQGQEYDARYRHVGGLIAAPDRPTYDVVSALWSSTTDWR